MPNNPLTKDLVDQPALWRLSLLIGDDALDVLAHRVVGEASLVSERITFDRAATSPAAALEEAVYANPLLLAPFGKTDIVVRTGDFFIVPPETAADHEAVEALASVFPLGQGTKVPVASPIDSRNSAVMMLDKGIANFLGRTYDSAAPQHVLSPLGQYFTHKSRLGNSSKMYVDLGQESVDILVYDHLGLAAANSLKCGDINDAAYFILAIARTAGLDPQAAEILLSGDSDRRAALTPVLRRFVNYVMPAIFPSAAYRGDPKALKAPFALTILPLCE